MLVGEAERRYTFSNFLRFLSIYFCSKNLAVVSEMIASLGVGTTRNMVAQAKIHWYMKSAIKEFLKRTLLELYILSFPECTEMVKKTQRNQWHSLLFAVSY